MKKNFTSVSKCALSQVSNSLQQSLNCIGDIKPLSPEREKELVLLVQGGGFKADKAKNELVRSYCLWMSNLARRIAFNNNDQEDILQVGWEALWGCLPTYDPSVARFLSYATPNVFSAMYEFAYGENCMIHLPRNKSKLISKYIRLCNTEDGQYPIEKFAEENHISLSAAKLVALYSQAGQTKSIDCCYDLGETDDNLGEECTISAFEASNAQYDKEDRISLACMDANFSYEIGDSCSSSACEFDENVEEYLHVLSPRDREIFVRSYGVYGDEEETAVEIAADLNMSAEAVQKAKSRAKAKICKYLVEHHPDIVPAA